MGLFSWLWKHSFLNSIINTIRYRHYLRKDHKRYDKIFYGGMFTTIVKKYLNVDLSSDWIGRLYGVINPNLDINGKFDPSTMIIEVDGDNTNNNEYVHSWIYKQLNLVSSVFHFDDMYDAINIDIKYVGPENHDNYLIVFDFVNRIELASWRKKMIWHITILAIIAIVLGIILL